MEIKNELGFIDKYIEGQKYITCCNWNEAIKCFEDCKSFLERTQPNNINLISRLDKQCASKMTVARICPYCEHKVTILFRGQHSYSREKCTNCGEEIIFPPISFRLAR